METIEIDGKKYAEVDVVKFENRKLIKNVIFLVVLLFVGIALVLSVNTLIQNINIIKQDPLIYGMGLHNFTSCQCVDTSSKLWTSNELGFIHTEQVFYDEPEFTFDISDFEVEENRTG